MDFERLEQAWRSPANRPSEDLAALMTEHLMTTLKTRRRTEALLAAIPVATLTLLTAVAGAIALRGADVSRGWPPLGMMGLCWVVMIAALWNGFRTRGRDGDRSVRDTLVRRMGPNLPPRRDSHVFWALAPVFVLPMWIGIQRLQTEGRLEGPTGWHVLALCGFSLAAAFGWNTLRFFMALKPEQRRLEALLREYEG
jgi:hypothetical protein